MKAFPNVFCIVDIETTGMRAAFSRIIDIAIIRVENGEVVKKYETLLNPSVSIPSRITEITGLTNDDLAGAPSFEEVALTIQEILSDATFIAHNVSFDYSFVKEEFRRIGIAFSLPKLCSVNLSRTLYPKEKGHNLDALIERFNLKMNGRHRAMPDAMAVLQFFKHVSKNIKEEILSEAISLVHDKPSTRGNLRELPDDAGVYFFYGEDQELLYIGKSKHVRTRVKSHFSKTPFGKAKRIQGETAFVDTIKTSGELSALLLEAALIKQESPLYNRVLRKKKKLVVAKKETSELGYDKVVLEWVSEIDASTTILGVFKTMSQAKKKLEELSDQYGLCQKLLGLDTKGEACFNYQLRRCDGACISKIGKDIHNTRVEDAFAKRKIRVWPYNGIAFIKEEETEERGTVFFIDNWVLLGSYRYESGSYERFGEQVHSFDYDTYKILARYLLDSKNKKTVRILSLSEYNIEMKRVQGEHEETVYID